MHISQPGNRSDKLAVYLVSRFCQKYIGVITKDGVWFTGKNTTLEDCHIVLVYLGGGTFRDTILKSAKPCFPVGKLSTSQEPVDSDYVYDPESPFGSPVPHRHTRTMGTLPPLPSKSGASGSSMEPAESSDSQMSLTTSIISHQSPNIAVAGGNQLSSRKKLTEFTVDLGTHRSGVVCVKKSSHHKRN